MNFEEDYSAQGGFVVPLSYCPHLEQINKNIVEFIVTHGLPKEFNRQEIKFFPLSNDE